MTLTLEDLAVPKGAYDLSTVLEHWAWRLNVERYAGRMPDKALQLTAWRYAAHCSRAWSLDSKIGQ